MNVRNNVPSEPSYSNNNNALNLRDRYNKAVDLHNHEFSILSGKNNAFVIVQSILIAAFVTLLVSKTSFPWAFDIIALFIVLLGALYCLLHNRAGQSAAQAAFRWRQYIMNLEIDENNPPMTTFMRLYTHTHIPVDAGRLRVWWSQLNCEGCVLERLPLPSAWLFTPILFLAWWFLSLIYIVCNRAQGCIHPALVQYHQSPLWLFTIFAAIAVFAIGGILGIISIAIERWWGRQQ